jgi:hypothetical protein
MDNFAMLPVFGGIIAKKANRNGRAKWLSFFNQTNSAMKDVFHSYPMVADLFYKKIYTEWI